MIGAMANPEHVAKIKEGALRLSPNIRDLAEATFFAGLRKAGVPEE